MRIEKLRLNDIIDEPAPSTTEPDWGREQLRSRFSWEPGKQLVKSIRDYQKASSKHSIFGLVAKKSAILRHRFWSVVTSADVPINCDLGGGIRLTHTTGIVIHPGAKIGPNCCLFQQVTIVDGVEIGGAVDIGAGAKIIRAVKIGNNAKIGANAVVLSDVPENATAVGIPAKIIR